MKSYTDWVKFEKENRGVSTVMEIYWLELGCPKCGCKEWQITNDGWCYCDECHKGYPTNGIWTNQPLRHYNKDGFHCFMCRGYGERDGEECDECDGYVTRVEVINEKQANE